MEGEHGRGKPNYQMPMPRDKSFGENEQSIEDGYMGSKRGKWLDTRIGIEPILTDLQSAT